MARVDLAHLRSEVSLLEKNEFSLLRAEISRLGNEATKLPLRLQDESRRVQSNVPFSTRFNSRCGWSFHLTRRG